MKVLICYATTEGMTRKIARFCADKLIARGLSVEVIGVRDAEEIALDQYDAAILAGSVHVGKVQADLGHFAEIHSEALNALPTLYLQVSLAAASTETAELTELGDIAARFCTAAGWTPSEIHHVAGAFRFTQYDFFKGWAMRWIASQRDIEIDPDTDTELTDWEALARLMQRWPVWPAT